LCPSCLLLVLIFEQDRQQAGWNTGSHAKRPHPIPPIQHKLLEIGMVSNDDIFALGDEYIIFQAANKQAEKLL
jgi:hypothetical protein